MEMMVMGDVIKLAVWRRFRNSLAAIAEARRKRVEQQARDCEKKDMERFWERTKKRFDESDQQKK